MSNDYSNYRTKKKKKEVEGEFTLPPQTFPDNMPSSFSKGHAKLHYEKDLVFEYKNYNGETVFWVKRDEATKAGKKKFTPFSYVGKKNLEGKTIYTWQPRGWPKDRVLYGEDLLRNNNKPVIIFEGEKATNAGRKLFKDHVCLCWSSGTNSVFKSNFKRLQNKKIILWPDNDEDGLVAMHDVARTLILNEITEDIQIIELEKFELPNGWDVADDIKKDWITPQLIFESKSEYKKEDKIWEVLEAQEDKREAKDNEEEEEKAAKKIGKELCYVMANDMFNKLGSVDFYQKQQLNNYHKHQIKNGNLTNTLLRDPDFARAETFITSAKFKPGLVNITKPGMIPLINKGIVLNIYIPNYLSEKEGDVKFLIDFFIWLIGEGKWKIIEQWIAYHLQYPGEKIKWSVVLVSVVEGAGKGLLARIISRILGFENVNENANYKHLTNTHNTLLVGTQVIVLNELSLGDFKSKTEGTNTLKNFVADDYYTCNFKGKPMVKLPNLTNFMLLSQDPRVLGLSQGVRRYFFCNIDKTEEEIIKKTEEGLYKKAWDFVDSDEGGSALIYYFNKIVKIPKPEIFKARAPQTDDLKLLIEQSKHPVQKKLEYDLTRPDELGRKVFVNSWCGLITFDELNEELNTTRDTWDKTKFSWGSYGDDALYKFLAANCVRWNNGDTTRQISIQGVKHRFYILDDSKCPIPNKSYKDLNPKDIEIIYNNYSSIRDTIREEEPGYETAKENIDEHIKGFKKFRIEDWIEKASQNTRIAKNFYRQFKNKTVDQVWGEIDNGTIKIIEKDPLEDLTCIKSFQATIKRGIRTPQQIVETYREKIHPKYSPIKQGIKF